MALSETGADWPAPRWARLSAVEDAMNLEKYSRQILFQPIGVHGQEKLRRSRVVIVGCGALGTAQANLLTRAGVGKVRIIDRDFVEPSNLHRQTLFDESDALEKLPKAVAAERKLKLINSDVAVEGIIADVDSQRAEELLAGFDLILDGTDNFEARYLLNDVAVKLGIPWSYGAVVGSYRTTLTVLRGPTDVTLCGHNSVQIHQRQSRALDLTALKARLEEFRPVRANNFLLKCLLDPYELTVFPDGRAIIKGTQDAAVARGVYAKYIGS